MLQQSNDGRLTVIQGPPGTGKTTVIASFVQAAFAGGLSGIWLVAQSNVAVKNIAEKLADFGLTEWKLLVSKDFFDYWSVLSLVDFPFRQANII
jgi:regulator of nonsense transcripts 1